MDPREILKKHILAPRARDQEEMNACFTGDRFWLAERFKNGWIGLKQGVPLQQTTFVRSQGHSSQVLRREAGTQTSKTMDQEDKKEGEVKVWTILTSLFFCFAV